VGILDNIKIKAGKLFIKSELQKQDSRKVVALNLNNANSVALLYKIEDEDDYKKVSSFVKYLKSEFGLKRVFFMGYWDDAKENPQFLQTRLDFDFFSKKELNWKGIPIGGNIENFIGEDFDILIDLNNYYNVPLRYLLVKSNAKLKVGPYSKENESFFDLMISSDAENFEEYCNQLVKYLSMINA
jgi:hypothetical protein